MQPTNWTGKFTMSMAQLCVRTSMQPVQKGEPATEALQDGFITKVHLRTEGKGKLMTIALTAGQRHATAVPRFASLLVVMAFVSPPAQAQ